VLRPLQKVIRTIGKMEADERNLATVNAKIEGWIEKLYVDVTGSYVKKVIRWLRFTAPSWLPLSANCSPH